MALRGVSGSLVSTALLEEDAPRTGAPAELRRIVASVRRLGPASSARSVFDVFVAPLLRHCGLKWSIAVDSAHVVVAVVGGRRCRALIATAGWDADLHELRRRTSGAGDPACRWWIGANGGTLRILDASRAYARRALDFDVALLSDDEQSVGALERVLGDSSEEPFSTLEALVIRSERHRAAVGRSLQTGVERALEGLARGFMSRRRRHVPDASARAEALTVIYRILFLLFAEARGLVPAWHPIYRESYTIESLRPVVESGRASPGLWQALQAISRLAHRGCRAGSLTVVPFNGRLFSPTTAPLAESLAIDDGIVRDVLLALTTDRAGDRRARISYADLGVEQLGAVYERLLDPAPQSRGGVRKATGTFYTPRSVTEYLVRRTLAPIVQGCSPDRLLALRVVDPAMGSGAFLVAACRYLAAAYEDALIAGGSVQRGNISNGDRAAFRRLIASRCLYGVDLNPTAVQIARLSLWLCTLAADRPLTFLDHHLRAGNSLTGARTADLTRQPPGPGQRRRAVPLPLFDGVNFAGDVRPVIGRRVEIALQPDDSAGIVRGKERAIDLLNGDRGPLAVWRALADAWCAVWFWPDDETPIGPRAWPSLASALQGRSSGLPDGVLRRWREAVRRAKERQCFFHWELEFPEVFFDEDGWPRDRAGFDAVIGNPPWSAAASLTKFARESSCYPLQGAGHANLYQLFAERMLQLASPSGRIGMLAPAGLLADHGCARLREALFDRCSVDAALIFDNHDGVFPIHRGMKFVLLSLTRGGSTQELPSRAGLRSPAALDDVPDLGPIGAEVKVPIALVRRFSGAGLAVPEFRSEIDRSIVAKVLATTPALGSGEGWHVSFGRELNATDDRRHLGRSGWPVLEGKLLEPFVARTEGACRFIEPATARQLLGSRAGRPRLAYREVAAATNRLTLIAAMLPASTVTTHTIFCLREAVPPEEQWCLCGLLNSFVANFLVRLRGGTHVSAAVMHHLPVPRPSAATGAFDRIARWSKHLARCPEDAGVLARLHAGCARAYGTTLSELRYILSTFPLVSEGVRSAVLDAFSSETDAV